MNCQIFAILLLNLPLKMKGMPEAQRMFEESQFESNHASIPLDDDLLGGGDKKPSKDHRFTFTIGAFNDGLKTNVCK